MNKSLNSKNPRNLDTIVFSRRNAACAIFSIQKIIVINATLLGKSLKNLSFNYKIYVANDIYWNIFNFELNFKKFKNKVNYNLYKEYGNK